MVNPSPHLPEVIERYQKEILRVFGVLDGVLSKQQWLVGNKCTIADISFVMYVADYFCACYDRLTAGGRWNAFALTALVNDYNNFNLEKDFPAFAK